MNLIIGIGILLFLVSLFSFLVHKNDGETPFFSETPELLDDPDLITISFPIECHGCSGCSNTTRISIMQLPGVKQCQVNATKGEIIVQYNPEETTDSKIQSALALPNCTKLVEPKNFEE